MGQHRSVLVTGAASGLGRAMALGLLEDGHHVVLSDLAGDALEQVRGEAAAHGARASFIAADLAVPADVEILAQRAIAAGQIDVLINNAGVAASAIRKDYFLKPVRFWEHSPSDTQRFFQVNSIAPYVLCAQLCGPMMRRGWGRIINVTTSLDTMLRAGMAGYGGSKAGLEAHTAIMAEDLKESGVTANVVVPGGPTQTKMLYARENGFDPSTLIQPSVMLAPVRWLISPEADHTSGRRIAAVRWDASFQGAEAAERALQPIAWRGYGVQSISPG